MADDSKRAICGAFFETWLRCVKCPRPESNQRTRFRKRRASGRLSVEAAQLVRTELGLGGVRSFGNLLSILATNLGCEG